MVIQPEEPSIPDGHHVEHDVALGKSRVKDRNLRLLDRQKTSPLICNAL